MEGTLRKLREADVAYYIKNDPIMSDYEYDMLVQKYEQETGEKYEVIEPTPQGADVKHDPPMLSLDNTYDAQELQQVMENMGASEYLVEGKMDGIAVELVYDDKLIQASTRGDGEYGESILNNVLLVDNIPKQIGDNQIIRGELMMKKSELERLNDNGYMFANPRNAAAGTARLKDVYEAQKRNLHFVAYDSPTIDGDQIQKIEYLESKGFDVPPNFLCKPDEVQGKLDKIQKMNLDLQLDGAVVKVNSKELQQKLGETSHHPRYMYAYKFPAEQKVTTVNKINVQTGRTGRITPVAYVEPVELSGTIVSKVTLHNEDEVNRLEIGVGDKILIHKSGEIIPQVLDVVEDSGNYFCFPDECPECGEKIMRDGQLHYCTNRKCSARVTQKLENWCKRVGIDGVGPQLVDQLVQNGITEPTQLYTLKKEDLTKLERVGDKKAENVLDEIQKSKKCGFAKCLAGLGIPGVGMRASREIAKHFKDLSQIYGADLTQIEGIGPKTANAIQSALKREVIPPVDTHSQQSDDGGEWEGLTFVITGKLSKSRKHFKELIQEKGGKVTSSVSGNTDYVLIGENPGKTKVNAAKNKGVKVIEEKALQSLP